MNPEVYMIDKANQLDMSFGQMELEAFSCNLIVDISIHFEDDDDDDVLSDWIIPSGHRGGLNNRESLRAWWLHKEDLVKVELERI